MPLQYHHLGQGLRIHACPSRTQGTHPTDEVPCHSVSGEGQVPWKWTGNGAGAMRKTGRVLRGGTETDKQGALIMGQAFVCVVSLHLRSNPIRQRTPPLFTDEEMGPHGEPNGGGADIRSPGHG